MADRLSPADFADKYLNLCVYIFPPENGGPDNSQLAPPGWRQVRVANYRLGANAYRGPFWSDISPRLGAKTKVKVVTIHGVHVDETLTAGELSRHFQQPFMGKGSPEQVQVAIQTLYRFRKAHLSLQAFLTGDFIGLDCNGFVGNYYQRVIQDTRWRHQNNDRDPGPTTVINGLMEMTGHAGQLKKLGDMASDVMYILAECDPNTGIINDPISGQANTYGHVMLTEPGTLKQFKDGTARVLVSEATADGARELRTNIEYTISQGKPTARGTVFHVERGSPTDTLDVRIARFKTS